MKSMICFIKNDGVCFFAELLEYLACFNFFFESKTGFHFILEPFRHLLPIPFLPLYFFYVFSSFDIRQSHSIKFIIFPYKHLYFSSLKGTCVCVRIVFFFKQSIRIWFRLCDTLDSWIHNKWTFKSVVYSTVVQRQNIY